MELIDIISSFFKQPDTDFAILINGAWGSGKTYFLKTAVAAEAAKIQYQIPNGAKVPYELVYVSLYGLSSTDELQKKLFLEINPMLKTKVGRISIGLVQKTLSRIGFAVNDKDEKEILNIFGGIPKNKILVFDDLERLDTSVLNEVFGFINTYTEHQLLKVIIIADEAKIKGKLPDYDSVKEKLIRFTYVYKPDLLTVLPGFINRYNNLALQQFLTGQKELICHFFDQGKHNNLRTLRFVFDLFEPLFNHTNKLQGIIAENKALFLKRFLFFIITYSIEYKKGESEPNLKALNNISEALNYSALGLDFFTNMVEEINEENEEAEAQRPEAEKFTRKFQKTYFEGSTGDFEYFEFLAHYIHSGDLNIAELTNVCQKNQQMLADLKGSPTQIALHKLKNCLNLNDDELLPLIEEIMGFVDQGSYKLGEYPVIFQNLANLAAYGFHGIKIDHQLIDRFKNGMQASLATAIYTRNIVNGVVYFGEIEEVQQMRDLASQLNESLQDVGDKKLARKVIEALTPDTLAAFEELLQKDEIKTAPIFQEDFISPEEFIEKFDLLNNAQKVRLNEILERFYERLTRYRNVFAKEISFYEKIEAVLTERVDAAKDNKVISTNITEHLLIWVQVQIKRLKKLDKNDLGDD